VVFGRAGGGPEGKDLRSSLKLQLPGFFASLRMTTSKGFPATRTAPPLSAPGEESRLRRLRIYIDAGLKM